MRVGPYDRSLAGNVKGADGLPESPLLALPRDDSLDRSRGRTDVGRARHAAEPWLVWVLVRGADAAQPLDHGLDADQLNPLAVAAFVTCDQPALAD